jgi:hypothetical protein
MEQLPSELWDHVLSYLSLPPVLPPPLSSPPTTAHLFNHISLLVWGGGATRTW